MSGLKSEKSNCFSELDKRAIIEDYLRSGLSKDAIWLKYTGRLRDHGMILRWMRRYGYVSQSGKSNEIIAAFVPQNQLMSKEEQKQDSVSEFEYLQLKKRILELENQLRESEMKSIAWQTMVELAEREFNISIKKKFNTKPSGK